MRLIRVGPIDRETPAVLDLDGTRRAVSAFTRDFDRAFFSGPGIAGLRAWYDANRTGLPVLPADARLGAPVAMPPFVLCVGLNYADHAREAGMPVPAEPILFAKCPTAVCGPDDDLRIEPEMAKLDWEVELGVVVGRDLHRADAATAAAAIAGYCTVHDVSERAWQLERGGQWIKGKSGERFAPVGPWLATPDELPGGTGDLAMELSVDGEIRQRGSTRTMIFDPVTIVSYASRFMRLPAGTLISTGTPPGVGMGMKPPRFLAAGSRVELAIAGLGRQRQRVVAAP